MPSSCFSLRTAARFAPRTLPSAMPSGVSTSVGSYPYSGCEQHVLVHSDGNVILVLARVAAGGVCRPR